MSSKISRFHHRHPHHHHHHHIYSFDKRLSDRNPDITLKKQNRVQAQQSPTVLET